LGEQDQSDVLREITDARIKSFLGASAGKLSLETSEMRGSMAISAVLNDIRAEIPEIFGQSSELLAGEDMELLGALIGNTRKLDPEKDWVEELPFFLTKIKNKETVF